MIKTLEIGLFIYFFNQSTVFNFFFYEVDPGRQKKTREACIWTIRHLDGNYE